MEALRHALYALFYRYLPLSLPGAIILWAAGMVLKSTERPAKGLFLAAMVLLFIFLLWLAAAIVVFIYMMLFSPAMD